MISKINTYFRGVITQKYQACIDSVIVNSKVNVNIIKTLPEGCISIKGNPRDESVGVRLNELCIDPYSLWLDTDCMLSRWFKDELENDGKPYVYSLDEPCCAIYGNGNRELIKEMYKWWLSKKGEFCCCFYIKQNMDKFNVFPEGVINHLRFGGRG
jgi:hypothetical protein